MSYADQLKEAKTLVNESVFVPALASSSLTLKMRNVVTDSQKWLPHFRRIGDLYAYLERCTETTSGGTTYAQLREAKLKSYEDILPEFRSRFGDYLNDGYALTDFVENTQYSSFDLSIVSRRFDNRSGGILPIGSFGRHSAVLLKCTLNGPYPNIWLEHGERLKTYIKSRLNPHSGVEEFNPAFQDNRAVIEYPNIPLGLFVRPKDTGPFTYYGLFHSAGVVVETDGRKWFDLRKRGAGYEAPLLSEIENRLAAQVAESAQQSYEARKNRLANAPKKPRLIPAVVQVFERNPDVIADVLERAKGICECCGEKAPFMRRSNGTPYLEVHHKIPLAEGGDDTTSNAAALCPNCHRNEHYGMAKLARQ